MFVLGEGTNIKRAVFGRCAVYRWLPLGKWQKAQEGKRSHRKFNACNRTQLLLGWKVISKKQKKMAWWVEKGLRCLFVLHQSIEFLANSWSS